MAHVTVAELVQFTNKENRLVISEVDPTLEVTYSAEVLSRLSVVADVTPWVDEVTTPPLVRSIIAALMVATLYEASYSEDSAEEGWYPNRLKRWAYKTLDDIIAGKLILDITVAPISYNNPSFFPTDLQETDGLGNEIKFRMAQEF